MKKNILTIAAGVGTVIMVAGNIAAVVPVAKAGAMVVFAAFVALGLDALTT